MVEIVMLTEEVEESKILLVFKVTDGPLDTVGERVAPRLTVPEKPLRLVRVKVVDEEDPA